jgi:hypothetical protein
MELFLLTELTEDSLELRLVNTLFRLSIEWCRRVVIYRKVWKVISVLQKVNWTV